MQQIQLNIIPFKPIHQKMTFAFYGEKQPDTHNASIKWDTLFDEFPADRDPAQQSYYCNFQPAAEGTISKEIDFNNAVGFAQKYFRYLIYNYLRTLPNILIFFNFVEEIEVWVLNDTSHSQYDIYNKFSLKIQFKSVSDSFEFVVSYNGVSQVSKHNLDELIPNIDSDKLKLVNYDGILHKYSPELNFGSTVESQFPVLNNSLREVLNIDKTTNLPRNQYIEHFDKIKFFYDTYINTDGFKEIIRISPNGFFVVPSKDILYVKDDSNQLQFGEAADVNPGYGINKYKPYFSALKENLKIILIYHKDDKQLIDNTISSYVKYGWHKLVNNEEKHSKSLHKFINHYIFIDDSKSIVFNSAATILEEVVPQINRLQGANNTKFIALMISPVSKSDRHHPQYMAYYRIKELLLYKDITSQVIYKEHLDKDEFYYFLPNIFTAMLAKLGGIPWQLANPVEEDLVIGIGAYKPNDAEHRFVGSAFCFNREGLFEGFNCFRNNDLTMFTGSIKEAVNDFKKTKTNPNRIIIHFYKEISDRKELQPILKVLNEIDEGSTPVIIITIFKTESDEMLGFDLKSPGKMPISGTHIKVGYNKFLLFNNIRYFGTKNSLNVRDYHLPIKLVMKSTKPVILEDMAYVKQLINQVYQFSRMYWKSISQQNLPVTIAYPEMVARIYPYFEHYNLPEFGKKNLWFL